MAKLGTVQGKWRRDYIDAENVERYTEYALREDGVVLKKQGAKLWQQYSLKLEGGAYEWHDWGWTVAKAGPQGKFRSTVERLEAQLGPKGFKRVR